MQNVSQVLAFHDEYPCGDVTWRAGMQLYFRCMYLFKAVGAGRCRKHCQKLNYQIHPAIIGLLVGYQEDGRIIHSRQSPCASHAEPKDDRRAGCTCGASSVSRSRRGAGENVRACTIQMRVMLAVSIAVFIVFLCTRRAYVSRKKAKDNCTEWLLATRCVAI